MENTKAKNLITVLGILLVSVICFTVYYIFKVNKNNTNEQEQAINITKLQQEIASKEEEISKLKKSNEEVSKQIEEVKTINSIIVKSKNPLVLSLNENDHVLDYEIVKNKYVTISFDGKQIDKKEGNITEVKFHKMKGNESNNNKEYCIIEICQLGRSFATYYFYFVSDNGTIIGKLPIDRGTSIGLKNTNKELSQEIKSDCLEYYYPAYENNHNNPNEVGVRKYKVIAGENDIIKTEIGTLKFKEVEMSGAW